MTDIIEENGDGDIIAAKLNNLNEFYQIAETDATVSAGAVTSIPIATLSKSILPDAFTVYLVDKATGEQHELTLDDAMETGDEVMTIEEYTFAGDIVSGSAIYVKMIDILNYLFYAP